MKDESINIFWFKRDLRLEDNEGLQAAIAAGKPLLLLYFYEPSVWQDPHYSDRHKYFIQETLAELQEHCRQINLRLLCLEEEVLPFLDHLNSKCNIDKIYSTMETGLDVTYQRDLAFAKACSDYHIKWHEFQNNGILRAIKNRNSWREAWYSYMKRPVVDVSDVPVHVPVRIIDYITSNFTAFDLDAPNHPFQKGGRKAYTHWRTSFFNERLEYYSEYISKPEQSRYGCSRLSPYISWGVCSIRELYQQAQNLKKISTWKRQINAFNSRLRWQSHFIQKFESEPRMEFEAINKGFLDLPQPLDEAFVEAWKKGKTGYPLVDASVRCVAKTGYINFRMRSMIVSFLTHHLFQHFTTGSDWLARQFLDFEPGIHYGQFQMQAGLTGTNTVRVYNPQKNALDHDPEAIFIKKWVPELKDLPTEFAIQPYSMSEMEQVMHNVTLGVDYPYPIVDLKEGRANALKALYGQRKNPLAQSERLRILERHTIRRASDKDDAVKV